MGIKSTRLKEKLHAQCDVILKAKVQRSARTDKRRYLGSLAREVEAAIQHQKETRNSLQDHKAFVEVRCITFN